MNTRVKTAVKREKIDKQNLDYQRQVVVKLESRSLSLALWFKSLQTEGRAGESSTGENARATYHYHYRV